MTNRNVWQNKNVSTIEPNTNPDFSVLCLKWVDIFLSVKFSSQILLDLFNFLAAHRWSGEAENLLAAIEGGTKLCLCPIFPVNGLTHNACLESIDATLDLSLRIDDNTSRKQWVSYLLKELQMFYFKKHIKWVLLMKVYLNIKAT